MKNEALKWAVAALTTIALALGTWSLSGVSGLQITSAVTSKRVDNLEEKFNKIDSKLDRLLESR